MRRQKTFENLETALEWVCSVRKSFDLKRCNVRRVSDRTGGFWNYRVVVYFE